MEWAIVAYLRYYFRAEKITAGHLLTTGRSVTDRANLPDPLFLASPRSFHNGSTVYSQIAMTIRLSVCLSPPWQFWTNDQLSCNMICHVMSVGYINSKIRLPRIGDNNMADTQTSQIAATLATAIAHWNDFSTSSVWSALKWSRLSQQSFFFVVVRDLVYFTTCFGRLGHHPVISTMHEILGRKLSAYIV